MKRKKKKCENKQSKSKIRMVFLGVINMIGTLIYTPKNWLKRHIKHGENSNKNFICKFELLISSVCAEFQFSIKCKHKKLLVVVLD